MKKLLNLACCLLIAIVMPYGDAFPQNQGAKNALRLDTSVPDVTQQYDSNAWKEGQRLTTLGWKALDSKNPVEALGYFRQALPLHLSYEDNYLGIAKSFEQLGKLRPAMQAYQKALFKNSGTTFLGGGTQGAGNMLAYAGVCTKLGELKLAKVAYIEAAKVLNEPLPQWLPKLPVENTEVWSANDIKSAVLLALAVHTERNTSSNNGEHHTKALSYLDQSASLKPRWAVTHMYRGRILEWLGKKSDAKNAYNRAADYDDANGRIKAAALESLDKL